MRKYLALLIITTLFICCSKDNYRDRNPYLPDYNFSIDIDMSLPLYSELQFPSNPVLITQAGIGINGIIVMNTGGGFVAWEASCPNQELGSCSRLTIDGIHAVCPCDSAEYDLFGGDSPGKQYRLKSYPVEVVNDSYIRVYN